VFLWLPALALMLALPFFILLYQRTLTKSSQAFLSYPNTNLVTRALGAARPDRLSFFLYLAAFAVAAMAFARPITNLFVPGVLSGVVFAVETGRSMYATDIAPSRMEATKYAAKEILEDLPVETAVGLATFNNYDTLTVPLTLEHDKVREGIDLLNQGGGYAFSNGIIAALQTFPDEDSEEQIGAIILFSHGHDNSGNDVLELADQAAARGIKIHTVGVGTHGNNFSEDFLQIVAERTGGRYYPIFSAEDLTDAHRDLVRVIALRPEAVEVSAFVSLFAAFLLMASLLLATLQRKVI
jgi:Ca-activated chloride channel homolog